MKKLILSVVLGLTLSGASLASDYARMVEQDRICRVTGESTAGLLSILRLISDGDYREYRQLLSSFPPDNTFNGEVSRAVFVWAFEQKDGTTKTRDAYMHGWAACKDWFKNHP